MDYLCQSFSPYRCCPACYRNDIEDGRDTSSLVYLRKVSTNKRHNFSIGVVGTRLQIVFLPLQSQFGPLCFAAVA